MVMGNFDYSGLPRTQDEARAYIRRQRAEGAEARARRDREWDDRMAAAQRITGAQPRGASRGSSRATHRIDTDAIYARRRVQQ